MGRGEISLTDGRLAGRIVVGEVLDTYIAEEPHWPLLYFGSGYHFPSRREATHLIPAADPYR